MRITYTLLLFFTGVLCTGYIYGMQNPLARERTPAKDIGIDEASGSGGWDEEFRVNLLSPDPFVLPRIERINLFEGIPEVGHYGKFYNFRSRWALIQTNPAFVLPHMPSTLRKQLALYLGVSPAQLDKTLAALDLKTYIMIHGTVKYPKEDSKDLSYNLVMHPLLAAWDNRIEPKAAITMGIFDGMGVRQLPRGSRFYRGPIILDQLTPIGISIHKIRKTPDFAISPNNARFGIEEGRPISTFWSAAVSPNKQHVVITYHIMANTAEMDKQLRTTTASSLRIGNLLDRGGLTGIVEQLDLTSPFDAHILRQATALMRAMITGAPAFSAQERLQAALYELAYRLDALEKALASINT